MNVIRSLLLTGLSAGLIFGSAASGADITFYSFGDSHYGAAGGGMTNWVHQINRLAGQAYPEAFGGGRVAPPRGVLALGDLINDAGTARGPDQWEAWKADYGVNGEGTCIYPVFENFGNHDLHKNRFVQLDIIQRNLRRPGLTAISTNGLHYSWDRDGVHFVALGLYPADNWVPENKYGAVHDPEYALSFLRWDLENNVGDSGRPVITMHHYDFLTDWWPAWQKLEYPRVLDGYNVVLILHGHQGAPHAYQWQGYTVSGQNGILNVCHITTNQLRIVQCLASNTWGKTFTKAIEFPDPRRSWNGRPRNGDRHVHQDTARLSWRIGADVQTQDLYFGTSSNEVFSSTTPAQRGLPAGVTNAPIPPAFLPLKPGTEYFWRVDQRHGTTSSKGRIWSFRTQDAPSTNELTFLFVADVHYQENTLLANQRNVRAMNAIPGTPLPPSLGGSVKTPRGVIFGGDAASEAKLWQFRFYTNDFGLNGEGMLQFSIAGEVNGNHDGGLGNVVADGMVARNRSRSGLSGISSNGLHISWDWDGIHFVTLGVRPGSNVRPYNSHQSLEFLSEDLARNLGNTGSPVILVQHFGLDAYAGSWWTAAERSRYYDVIKDYNVIGIFHGHTHTTSIYQWNDLDVFHPPHMQFGGSVSEPVTSSHGFFVARVLSNTLSVVERKADGTWGTNRTKPFYRSYKASGLPAIVNNSAPSNILATTATLKGRIVYQAASPTVTRLYYGQKDAGTNPAAWSHAIDLADLATGEFAHPISGLQAETTYFYRCQASNQLGTVFAPASASFTTQPPVAVDHGLGATDVTDVSAVLNGTLRIANAAPAEVFVYWGPTDGGTNTAGWAHKIALGPRELGQLSCPINGLKPQMTYYYRCFASTPAGARWAPETCAFETARDFTPWTQQMKITFQGYTRPEPLRNFPLLIVLQEQIPGFSYSQFTSPQGADLRFATANNSELKYEIDEWNPGGKSYIWVQVPVIAGSNDFIRAYWGNPAETAFPSYTTNGAAWSEGYAAVWHLREPNARDSLGMNHGASQRAAIAPGVVGAGLSMSGNAETGVIVSPVHTNLDIRSDLSIEAWVNARSTTPGGILTKGAAWGDYNLHTKGGAANRLSFELKPFCADSASAPMGTTSFRTGQWYHVCGTWDGTTARVYVDGKEEGSKDATGSINTTSRILKLGTLNERYLNGSLDEVRISNVSRSSNWIWATWMSQASNAVFLRYEAQSHRK